jgi:hypothetical protein
MAADYRSEMERAYTAARREYAWFLRYRRGMTVDCISLRLGVCPSRASQIVEQGRKEYDLQ